MTCVLVIDDDYHLRRFVCSGLGRRGFDVIDASTVSDAMARLSGVDVVLCDIFLGADIGHEFVARARKERPNLPIIMVSGLARTSKLDDALDLGAVEWIRKPFSIHDITAALKRATGKE